MSDQATTTISSNEVTTTTTVTAANADLATSTSVTLPTPMAKPGYQTSEFWLKVAAMLLSALYASGVLTSSTALAVAGIAATVLTALGYTVARTMVKTAALVMLLAMLPLALTSACTRGTARAVGEIAWDCTEPQRAEAASVLTPLAASAIRAAASADGRLLDASLLKAALGTANLKTHVGSILMCAAAEAFAAIMSAAGSKQVADPAAAPLELEPAAARAAFDRLRNEQFPGVRITTGRGVI